MKNKEELEKKTGVKCFSSIDGIKKWNYAIMNPPYGDSTSSDKKLHHTFVTKCNEISDINVVVMPFRMFEATNNKFDKYKDEYNKSLVSVEGIKAEEVFDIKLGTVGIYKFDNTKHPDNIKIIYPDGRIVNTKDLFELTSSDITDTDRKIFEILDNKGKYNYILFSPRNEDKRNNLYNFTQNWLNKNKANVYLTTNVAAGSSRPGSYYTSKTGDICSSSQEFIDLMKSYRGKAIVVMKFNNIKEAQNCKIALKNPILRMCLVKFMCDQNIKKSYYKYIPDIDWSDDIVKTDEGLLEVCGCPKDKCKEYAEYAKDYIDKIDNEWDNR